MHSYDLLSLHTDDQRQQKFKDAPDIFFNQKLNQWIVFKPELVIELLRDNRLLVPQIITSIEGLEARYRRKFPNLLFVARWTPLLMEGPVHRDIRRGLADMMTEGRARTTAALPDLMQRYVQPLGEKDHAEWMDACLVPLVKDLFCHMCNCPVSVPFPKLVLSRIFDRFVSLAALDAIEEQVALLRQEIRKRSGTADEDLEGAKVALFILGRDSLLGTLATSLLFILRQNLDRPFADIEFPDYVPETGVAIAERVAEQDLTVASVTIAAGQRVRLFFQPMSDASSTVGKQNLFGTGAHSCLGRPISLDVWRALCKTIRSFPQRLSSIACDYETNNIFVVPRHLRTEQSR